MDLKKFLFFIFFFLPILVWADFNVEDYRYYKDLQGSTSIGFFVIDEEIYKGSLVFLADLRVIRDDGKEIPYEIKTDKDIVSHKNEQKIINIISKKKISKNETEYLLDLGSSEEYHNKIQVISSSSDYSRQVYIYGSQEKDGKYEKLNLNENKAEVFSVSPARNDSFIEYKFNNYRYLKLIISPNEDDFILDNFVQNFDRVNIQKGERRFNEVKVETFTSGNKDILLLDLEQTGIFVEKLNLDFIEGIFVRDYVLFSSNDNQARKWKEISRGQIYKNSYKSNLVLDVFDNKRFYKLIIDNKENSQLHLVSANFESFIQKVYLPNNLNFNKYQYKVYYGATNTDIPKYKFRAATADIQNNNLVLSPEHLNNLYNPQSQNFFKKYFNNIIILVITILFLLLIFWFSFKIILENKRKKENKKDIISQL